MAQLGMDVDAVEAAGRELQAKAQTIDSIVAQVNRSVASLETVWDGRDAQAFNASWPAIQKSVAAASQAVAGLGQSALNNASEQRQASGASGSGLPGTPGSPIAPHSSTAPSLEDQFFGGVTSFLNSTIPGTPWSVDQITGLVPGAGTYLDTYKLVDALHSGQSPALAVIDLAAGAAKDTDIPAVKLFGIAAGVFSTFGTNLGQAVVNGTPPSVALNYIATNPLDAFEGAVQANVQALPDLIGDIF